MPKKKSSSRRWCQEHQTDAYVKQAKQDGFRSRAAYKLAQIHERDRLFKPGMTVIDLGAAPGGWSQWVNEHLQQQVTVFALDILPMDALVGVTFLQGDFREQAVLDELLAQIGEQRANLVMSDMSPNISGNKSIDQPRMMYLAELARDLAYTTLAEGGDFLTKVFQGEGIDEYIRDLRANFKQVMTRKPDASRARSPEIYLLARHYKNLH